MRLPLRPLRTRIPAISCLIRAAATSELLQTRLMHQTDKDMMLSESAEWSIAINVEAVFVRWMVLAVMGSHLTACKTSEILKLN